MLLTNICDQLKQCCSSHIGANSCSQVPNYCGNFPQKSGGFWNKTFWQNTDLSNWEGFSFPTLKPFHGNSSTCKFISAACLSVTYWQIIWLECFFFVVASRTWILISSSWHSGILLFVGSLTGNFVPSPFLQEQTLGDTLFIYQEFIFCKTHYTSLRNLWASNY